MVLSEVEETVTTVEVDEETFEEMYKVPIPFNMISYRHYYDESTG